MAAFEVLSLDPAVPQIRAPGAGDTYSVPREMAISVNSATDALRITQTGAGLALRVEDEANPDATPFVVTADGSVGIGTSSPSYRLSIEQSANAVIGENIRNVNTGAGAYAGLYFGGAASATDVFIGAVGDSNTAFGGARSALFGTNTTTPIAFYTNGTEKMRLTSAGNVGIGTTTPNIGSLTGTVLTINGSAQSNLEMASGGTSRFRIASSSTDTTIETRVSASIVFGTNSSEKMRLTSAGDLGIGTSAPQAVLDLGSGSVGRALTWSGSASTRYASIFTAFSAADIVLGYGFHGSSSADSYLSSWTGTLANAGIRVGTGTVQFFTNTATAQTAGNAFTPTERMRLTSAGELLVGGTTSLNAAQGWLALEAANNSAGINIFRNDTTVISGNVLGDIRFVGNDTTSNTPTILARMNAVASGTHAAGDNPTDLTFGTTATGSATVTERMRLDSSGNLGLGVTPSAWSSAFGPVIQVKAATGGGALTGSSADNFRMFANTFYDGAYKRIDAGYATQYEQAAGQHSWYTAGTSTANSSITFTQAMTLDASGNLLVGTTSSSASANAGAKIFPGGTMRCVNVDSTNSTENWSMYSTGAANYRFYVGWGGTVYATNTTISAISDQRFKENIQDLDVGLDAILALKPRKFDWKEGKGKDIKGDRGFIAQEIAQVFPDLVDEWKDPAPEGEESYKSVRQDLIPVLVKAIQELKAELDATKAKVAALESK